MEINVNELAKAIQDTLENYSKDVVDKMEKSSDANAKKGAKKLRESGPKKTGKYRAGWTKKKVGTAHIVYNKDRYQLSHLLESGYMLRNGRRKEGRPHIKPVEVEMVRDFENDIKKAIQDG